VSHRKTYYKVVWQEICEGITMKKTLCWLSVLWFLAIISITLCSCEMFKCYPQDNFLEEITEQYIENKTGIDLDLSPYSAE